MQDIGMKEDFVCRLKEVDIEVVYCINFEGCLYGIIFIDYISWIVFNGLCLGKFFFVNVFNELFNNLEVDCERLILLIGQEVFW